MNVEAHGPRIPYTDAPDGIAVGARPIADGVMLMVKLGDTPPLTLKLSRGDARGVIQALTQAIRESEAGRLDG